ALGFVGPRRPMRRPQMFAKFRTAFAQQALQRLLAGRAAECAYPSFPLCARKARSGLCLFAIFDRPTRSSFGLRLLFLLHSEGAGEIGIELAGRDRRAADITLLRRLGEIARHRSTSAMRLRKVGAAVPGIIRRRLQPARTLGWGIASLRADAGAALADA